MRQHRTIDQPIENLATHPTDFVTVRVVAQYLDVGPRKVRTMIEAGSLPVVRLGREWRVLTDGLRRSLTGTTKAGR